ncbi:hypothetical protein M8C21_008187 [Ambrosia artemisiifolia]|uniref:DNA-directed RNA polymerase n=1 Tax=Ambrosia artemisiifolia TaxID=4212 RepID=A0AAD5GYF6_AMBAR|nr:hypothetical protein M8C21_008187 [Ambrosia artemisiifolia]
MVSELYEASKQTANPWIFEPKFLGKSRIFNRRTRDPFEQPFIIGKPYILKLINQVDDKIHGCSSGRYSRLTQQPLKEVLGTITFGERIPTPEDAPESFQLFIREL